MNQKKQRLNTLLAVISLSIAGSVIYELPYIKYVYYDKLVKAFHMTNTQAGSLLSIYAIGCLLLYIPGGIAADCFSTKKLLVLSLYGTGILGFVLAFSMNYPTAVLVFFLFAVTTSFVFWTTLNKCLRRLGGAEDSGSTYGWYYALGSVISLVCSIVFWALYASTADARRAMFRTISAMSVAVLLAGLLVQITFRKKTVTGKQNPDKDGFPLSDLGRAVKNPYLWWAALIMFMIYTIYSNVSYFTPYLSSQLGMEVEESAFLGIIRGYVFYFLSPLGGYLADRILKSTLKLYAIGFAVLGAVFYLATTVAGTGCLAYGIALSLLASAFAMMLYGVMWSILNEIKIPLSYAATAIGLASMVIYLPDLFVPTMIGNWLDRLGEKAGYHRMFLFFNACCIVAVVLSISLVCALQKSRSPRDSKAGKTDHDTPPSDTL